MASKIEQEQRRWAPAGVRFPRMAIDGIWHAWCEPQARLSGVATILWLPIGPSVQTCRSICCCALCQTQNIAKMLFFSGEQTKELQR